MVMAKWWKSYRWKDNPLERLFYKAWTKEPLQPRLLECIMTNDEYGRRQPVSDRDQFVAASVIQWLGTPVGQDFLKDCGFERANK